MSPFLSNALSVLFRPPKVVIAVAITLLIYLIAVSTPSNTLDASKQTFIKNNLFSIPYTFRGQAVLENAHLVVEDADDLLPHFSAVVKYPSMPMSDAKAGCGWDETIVNLQWQYDASRGEDFAWIIEDEDDLKIEFLRKQWQYFVANEMRPWAAHKKKFSGRGIVIPAGHEKSVHRTKVILKMLNKLGSTLPVEIAHWGGTELTNNTKQQFQEIRSNIYFNDLSLETQPMPTYYSVMNNYHLKIPSVLNSRFAEVILLDSDNIPVIDPAELFDSDTYKEFGTIFWPDIVRTRRQNPIWAITNTRCRMDEWELESGQLVVDKRKYWYHLQLATWFETEHHGYYERLLLGDKDMFRFAWHALKTKFGVPSRWITSVGTLSPGQTGNPKEVYCGHTFAQHHPDPDGKVAFLHGGLLKSMHPSIIEWQLEHQGGIFQAYKRSTTDQNKGHHPSVKIEFDPAYYMPDERAEDFMTAWCTDFPLDSPHPLEDLLPGFQQTYKEAGGYWMLAAQ